MGPQWDFPEQIVWRPTPVQADGSRLAAFLKKHSLSNFDELLRRSTDNIEWFWDAVLQDLDRRFPGLRFRVVDEQDRIRRHMRVFVGREETRTVGRKVADGDEVLIFGALSGG